MIYLVVIIHLLRGLYCTLLRLKILLTTSKNLKTYINLRKVTLVLLILIRLYKDLFIHIIEKQKMDTENSYYANDRVGMLIEDFIYSLLDFVLTACYMTIIRD